MPISKIIVKRQDGAPVTGKKVTLLLPDGLLEGAFTDSNGVASISHSATGETTIYVAGQGATSSGEFHAPGTVTVVV